MTSDPMKENTEISRRDFLKRTGLAAVSLFLPRSLVPGSDRKSVPSYLEDKPAELSNQIESGLASTARSYIAKTPEEADEVSTLLRGQPNSSASNICGPLSYAPLLGLARSGGSLVHKGTPVTDGILPSEMWIASPEGLETSNPKLFEWAFDPQKFDHIVETRSIGDIDFNTTLLKPGDFIFFQGGSSAHFITVSSEDEAGRLFAVTNLPDADGEFIIDEVMLWDPATKKGFLRDFAKGYGPDKITTGKNGYHLWRRRDTLASNGVEVKMDERSLQFRNTLQAVLGNTQGDWNIVLFDLDENKGIFYWRNRIEYHPASTIKVPLAAVLMRNINQVYEKEIQAEGFAQILTTKGAEGRSFDQLIRAMLVYSEEAATETCARYAETVKPLIKQFEDIGLHYTTYIPRKSTQMDLLHSWKLIFGKEFLNPYEQEYLLNMLSEQTDNDGTRIGVIPQRIPHSRVWNKRGSLIQGIYTMQDTGVVEMPWGKRYYIGIAGTRPPNASSYDDRYLVNIIEEVSKKFCTYALASRPDDLSRSCHRAE